MPIEVSILLVCVTGRMRAHLSKQIRNGFNESTIHIKEAGSVEHALRVVENLKPDLVVTEAELPKNYDTSVNLFGPELGYVLKEKKPDISVILLGNSEHPEQSIREAMLNGAISGYRLISNMTPLLWRQLIFYSLNLIDDQPLFIGSSPAIQTLKKELEIVTKFDMPVLLLGESGTGKTILAKYIHQNSQRTKGPFVPVNCAAIPQELIESELFGHNKGAYTGAENARKGLFQAADGGVLFLDEIGDMPLSLQPRLLRAVETGLVRPVGSDSELKVNVRVISATNQDINQAIANGCFRSDLYYRLQNEELQLPPLRKRLEDIAELAEAIILKACRKDEIVSHSVTLSPDVIKQMKKYAWPGNIRELANLLEKAVRRTSPESPCIEALNLPDTPHQSTKTQTNFDQSYQQYKNSGMTNRKIADKLGISERTLYRKK